MTVLRLAQHLAASPRLSDLVRLLDSDGQAEWNMTDLHYWADADHPIARRADTDALMLIPSADLLRFIAEVDTIIDVTVSLRPTQDCRRRLAACHDLVTGQVLRREI